MNGPSRSSVDEPHLDGLGPPGDWGVDPVRAAQHPGGAHVRFRVLGVPVPQGSMKAVPTPAGPRLVDGNKGLAVWRSNVAAEADVARLTVGTLRGPLGADVTFHLPMPASRPKRDRLLGLVPAWHRPDLDKLLRAVLDGLTAGGLIGDDAQIASLAARKDEIWGGWTGAEVRLHVLAPAPRRDI